jgi:shikimate kinase
MNHLKAFSKLIYIFVPLEVIETRIGYGQKRGLASPEETSIEDIYNERKPMYERWAHQTIDGTLPIDDLINLLTNKN